MKLLVKFNLVFIAVFLLGLASAGAVTWRLLERNAQAEVLQQARFMMEKALAVRAYTSAQVAPLLETQMRYGFLPQSVPAYSATEVLATLLKNHSEFSYKEATLNPTNPRDRALEWEADLIRSFKSDDRKEMVGQRSTAAGTSLYIARPIRIADGACLRCHGTPEAAPRTMVERYGAVNGFGWQVGEVIGTQVVSVPMALPLARAREAWNAFMIALTVVFAAIGVALNAMLWWLVIRPVTRLARIANEVSLGDLKTPVVGTDGRDEIGALGRSFARMRRSLVQAMAMLEESPA